MSSRDLATRRAKLDFAGNNAMEAAGFAEPSRSGTAPVGKVRPTKRRNSASPMRKSSINALLGRHSRSSKKLGRDSAASQEETDEDAVRLATRRRRRSTARVI